MPNLKIRYHEDIRESRIASEVYKALRKYGFEAIEIRSSYHTRSKIVKAEFVFGENHNPGLTALEGILNDTGLLEKVEMTNESE